MAFEMLTEQSFKGVRTAQGQAAQPPDLTPLKDLGAVGELVATLLSADPVDRKYTDANRLIADLARAAGREVPPETSAQRESYLKAAPLTGRNNAAQSRPPPARAARPSPGSV